MTGNRKLISFIFFILVIAVMRAPGWISDETFNHLGDLALWLFIGANVAEHLGPAAKDLIGKFGTRG